MEFLKIPENFSSVFCDAVYSIGGVNTGAVTDIEIVNADTGGILGVKRYKGNAHISANIGGYLRGEICPEPLAGLDMGFHVDAGRTVAIYVKTGGLMAGRRLFTGASDVIKELDVLSKMPFKKVLAYDEWDEISIAVPDCILSAEISVSGEVDFKVVLDDFTARQGIVTFVMNMEYIGYRASMLGLKPEDCRSASVKISTGHKVLAEVEYAFVKNAGGEVRMCWLNSLGGIDYHTFTAAREERVAVSKERIITGNGCRCVSSVSERMMFPQSDYYPDRIVAALGEIVFSPKVWLVGGKKSLIPADIVTDGIAVRSDELLNAAFTVRVPGGAKYKNV